MWDRPSKLEARQRGPCLSAHPTPSSTAGASCAERPTWSPGVQELPSLPRPPAARGGNSDDRVCRPRATAPAEGTNPKGGSPARRPARSPQAPKDTDSGPERQEPRACTTLRTGLRKTSFLCRQTLTRTRKARTRNVSSPVLHRTTILCRRLDVTAAPAPPSPAKGPHGHGRETALPNAPQKRTTRNSAREEQKRKTNPVKAAPRHPYPETP